MESTLSLFSQAFADKFACPFTGVFQHAIERRLATISLTANENILSETARTLGQNRFYDRYYFQGEHGEDCLYAAQFNGMQYENFPEVEALKHAATEAAKRLFCANYIEFRVLSGVHCTLSMVAALTKPGDTVWALDPACGGHFATGPLIHRLGRECRYLRLNQNNEFDESYLTSLRAQPPAAIILDHGLANEMVSAAGLREWLNDNGMAQTLIIYDASHLLGLIAGKALPNPLENGADILQGNTHKSFPGPHRAIIATLCPHLGKRISEGLEAGMVSSPNLPSLLQMFITLLEMDNWGEAYARQMCINAQLLAQQLAGISGWEVLPTHTHKILLMGERSVEMASRFNELGIRVNNKSLNGQPCLRLGVQEITRLGITSQQLVQLGELMRQILLREETAALPLRIEALAKQLNLVHYSFDSGKKS